MWKLPSGRITKHLNPGRFFTHNGVNHPETNLKYWSDAEILANGCYRVVENGYDKKHFRSIGRTETIAGAVVTIDHTTERRYTIKRLKRRKIKSARQEASSLISPYNWHFTRAADDPTFVVRPEIKTYTSAVRTAVNTITTEVKALTTYRQVINYNYYDKWPTSIPDPDDPLNGDLIEP